jgi:hypothetical protein
VGSEPDYSRAGLARFIDFVVEKGLVHPATAQGWRVATTKVLDELPPAELADVRRIELEPTFRAFLNRNPGRLSPISVGEYRRRVGRAIEEFVRWVEDPGAYAFRAASRAARAEPRGGKAANAAAPHARPQARPGRPTARAPEDADPSAAQVFAGGIALGYPLRPDLLAQVIVPRDLTVEEARRMGAFLVTLAVDFRPPEAGLAKGCLSARLPRVMKATMPAARGGAAAGTDRIRVRRDRARVPTASRRA